MKDVNPLKINWNNWNNRNAANWSKLIGTQPQEVTEKGTRLKLHSFFLNFNSCPRSISSFKSGILFWTGI